MGGAALQVLEECRVRRKRLPRGERIVRLSEKRLRRRPLLECDPDKGFTLVVVMVLDEALNRLDDEREAVDDVVRVVVRVLLHERHEGRTHKEPFVFDPEWLHANLVACEPVLLPLVDGGAEVVEERGRGLGARELVEEGDARGEECGPRFPLVKRLNEGGEGRGGRRGAGVDGIEGEPEAVGRCCETGKKTGQTTEWRRPTRRRRTHAGARGTGSWSFGVDGERKRIRDKERAHAKMSLALAA